MTALLLTDRPPSRSLLWRLLLTDRSPSRSLLWRLLIGTDRLLGQWIGRVGFMKELDDRD